MHKVYWANHKLRNNGNRNSSEGASLAYVVNLILKIFLRTRIIQIYEINCCKELVSKAAIISKVAKKTFSMKQPLRAILF